MSSALELRKVSDTLKERVVQSHLTGESGLLKLFSELTVPDTFEPAREIPHIAKQMAEQTAVNLETIISAAIIILSHSTADDVFTAACQLSSELDPKEWFSELNLDRSVSLRSLIENGSDAVLAEEIQSFRTRLGNKSLPNRAEMLFRHVQVRQHKDIPVSDPAYFRISALKEVDELRIGIVHGSALPRIARSRSENAMVFLHEAAFVAIRSIMHAYRIELDWDQLMQANKEAAANA